MIQSKYCIADSKQALLATAIHNGNKMPSPLLEITGVEEKDRLREEDPYTGKIAELFKNHIVVHSSRFMVDLNRSPDKAVYLTPEDAWGLPVRTQAVPNDMLSELRNDYHEWYSILHYQICRLLESHPFITVLDLHSYNHRRNGPDAEYDSPAMNPDIILGRNNMPEKYYNLIDDLRQRLDQREYFGRPLDVRCDVKFTGGYLSRWLHHNFPDQVICIAIEFKKIFMNEWTGRLNPVSFIHISNEFVKAVMDWHLMLQRDIMQVLETNK